MAKKEGANFRDAQVTIIMGKNGTGKSTFAENIIKQLGGKAAVVTMNGEPKIWRPYPVIDASKKEDWEYTGIRQLYFMQHEKDTFKYIHRYFRDGILILDDCRGYITSNLDNQEYLKRLLIDFRHKMMDIYFVLHSPGQVPRQVWTFYSNVWVGATDALLPKSIGIDSGERITIAQKRVNERYRMALKKGDGSHYGIFELVQP